VAHVDIFVGRLITTIKWSQRLLHGRCELRPTRYLRRRSSQAGTPVDNSEF